MNFQSKAIHCRVGFNTFRTGEQNVKIVQLLVLLVLFCVCMNSAPADLLSGGRTAAASMSGTNQDAIETEYQIKAAFVYNFMKFTEWPKEKDPAADPSQALQKTPMLIGIVGVNRFGKSFEPIQEKTIRDHPIQVIEFPSLQAYSKKFSGLEAAVESYSETHLEKMRSCHVLYFCESEKDVLPALLKRLENGRVLTISDVPRFIEEGGVIGFKKEENKIRFEINLVQSERQSLRISSQLLKLAIRVKKEE